MQEDNKFIKYLLERHNFSYISGIIIDIVDYDDYYCLRIYRSNFNPDNYDVDSRTRFILDLNGILSEINGNGIVCYLEILETAPKIKAKD